MGSQQSLLDTLIHGNNKNNNNRKSCKNNQYRKPSFFQSAFHFTSNTRNHNPKDCCALWKAIKSILGIWTTGNSEIDEIIRETQRTASKNCKPWKWIPYEKFEDVKYIAKGGYSEVYSAWCTDRDLCGRVALKSLEFSENISSEYLQQLRVLARFRGSAGLIRIYGVTRDPQTNDYILVMKYAKCNLRQYIDKYFSTLSLSNKIELLVPISNGLKKIHQEGLTHGNLHPGNVLQTYVKNPTEKKFSTTASAKIYATPQTWSGISDLGLCGPASNVPRQILTEKDGFVDEPFMLSNADDIDLFDFEHYLFQEKQQDYFTTFMTPSKRKSSVYEKPRVYGVLPYVAPEVLRGQKFSQAADVFSFGFIIYEVFTGHPPYNDVPHDLKLAQNICKGHRPQIASSDMPHRVMKLITSCWDSRPEYRPTAQEIHNTMIGWYWRLDPEMTSLMRSDDEAFRGIREAKDNNNNSAFSSPSQTPIPPTPPTPGTPNSPFYTTTPFTTPLNTSISHTYNNSLSSLPPLSPNSTMSTTSSFAPHGYEIHREAIYTSRLLEFDDLPQTESWYF